MVDKIRGKDDTWHYLEINRGRYLCLEHGSFCSDFDNYAKKCPYNNCKNAMEINNVDRTLQIIRGLQERSLNRFSILYGVIGALGLFSFFQEPEQLATLLNLSCTSKFLLWLSSILFLTSFICYLISMNHVKTTEWFKPSKFKIKTITEWNEYIARYLSGFEAFHKIGNALLCFSVFFIIIFLVTQLS